MKSRIDDSGITCDEVINTLEIVLINFTDKKATCKIDCYTFIHFY